MLGGCEGVHRDARLAVDPHRPVAGGSGEHGRDCLDHAFAAPVVLPEPVERRIEIVLRLRPLAQERKEVIVLVVVMPEEVAPQEAADGLGIADQRAALGREAPRAAQTRRCRK